MRGHVRGLDQTAHDGRDSRIVAVRTQQLESPHLLADAATQRRATPADQRRLAALRASLPHLMASTWARRDRCVDRLERPLRHRVDRSGDLGVGCFAPHRKELGEHTRPVLGLERCCSGGELRANHELNLVQYARVLSLTLRTWIRYVVPLTLIAAVTMVVVAYTGLHAQTAVDQVCRRAPRCTSAGSSPRPRGSSSSCSSPPRTCGARASRAMRRCRSRGAFARGLRDARARARAGRRRDRRDRARWRRARRARRCCCSACSRSPARASTSASRYPPRSLDSVAVVRAHAKQVALVARDHHRRGSRDRARRAPRDLARVDRRSRRSRCSRRRARSSASSRSRWSRCSAAPRVRARRASTHAPNRVSAAAASAASCAIATRGSSTGDRAPPVPDRAPARARARRRRRPTTSRRCGRAGVSGDAEHARARARRSADPASRSRPDPSRSIALERIRDPDLGEQLGEPALRVRQHRRRARRAPRSSRASATMSAIGARNRLRARLLATTATRPRRDRVGGDPAPREQRRPSARATAGRAAAGIDALVVAPPRRRRAAHAAPPARRRRRARRAGARGSQGLARPGSCPASNVTTDGDDRVVPRRYCGYTGRMADGPARRRRRSQAWSSCGAARSRPSRSFRVPPPA